LIHPTAIVDPTAGISPKARIGPYAIIHKDVEIGEHTEIGAYTLVRGPTRIGKRNRIYQHCSLGEDPQDKKYTAGSASCLEIGDDNVIREFCSIHRGTEGGGGRTAIGSHNWIMAYCHLAHDCVVQDHTVLSNAVMLAGHVLVESYASIGGMVGVHQFCRIGAHSFVSAHTKLVQDAPPYCLVIGGQQSAPLSINREGLERRGFSRETMTALKEAFRTLYRKGLKVSEALSSLRELAEAHAEVAHLVRFLQETQRGVGR